MNWKRWVSVTSVTVLAACGGNNDTNNSINNGSTNNGATNNGTINNGATNNGSTNNGETNNGTANNGTNNETSNNTTGSMDCSFAEQDGDGNGTNELKVLDYFEGEDWEHPVRSIVTQQASGLQSNTYAIDQTWDANGNLVQQVVDFGNDGSTEWILDLPFDADGNQTGFAFDNDADGTPEFTTTMTYDEFGQLMRYEEDGIFDPATWTVSENADGTPNLVQTVSWLGENQPLTQVVDTDNDGTPEVNNAWTYDAAGRLTRVEIDGAFGSDDFSDLRRAADGTPDIIQENTYDADGNLILHREDGFERFSENSADDVFEQQDGTWDFIRQDFTYDGNGNATGWLQDGRYDVMNQWFARADGTFDRLQNITWNEVANRPGSYVAVSMEFDAGDDGSVDFAQSFGYDDDGNMTHRETDGVIDNTNTIITPADGTFQDTLDIVLLTSEKYLSYTRDFDGDGTDDVVVNATYNDDENLLTFERDGDMGPDSFEYGADGPADGNIDFRVTNTYDDLGRQTSALVETGDGAGGLEKSQGFTREYGSCEELEAQF